MFFFFILTGPSDKNGNLDLQSAATLVESHVLAPVLLQKTMCVLPVPIIRTRTNTDRCSAKPALEQQTPTNQIAGLDGTES